MDDFDISKIPSREPNEAPIPFDDSHDDTSNVNISHSPLNLGGSSPVEAPKAEAASEAVKPAVAKLGEKIISSDRITGVKTFFTKLHAGAIEFLDEQISNWLKNNPGITIKRTNTATGEVQGKKSEPNIIITIWY